MKVADYISEYLSQNEITHAFGMSGANIEDLFYSIQKLNKTEILLAKSEYSAMTMALGSYLATKKISAVLTTSGPGVLNTIPILAEAFTSKIPLILISGVVPLALEGNGAFQDTSGKGDSFDILKILEPCTSYQIKVEKIEQIPEALEMALKSSLSTKRPAAVLIPKNFFQQEIVGAWPLNLKMSIEEKKQLPPNINEAISFCDKMFGNDFLPPLIVLGEELIHLKDISPILNFVEKTGGRVALTPNSKGLFDHYSPQFLGLIGVMGHDEVNDYLANTRHVILIGTNFDLLNRFGFVDALLFKNVLVINEEKSLSFYKIQGQSVLEIFGDLELVVTTLLVNLKNQRKSYNVEARFGKKTNEPSVDLNLVNIINEVEKQIDQDANVFVDAGNTGASVIHQLRLTGSGVFYVTLGMGGMGNSIGAGIGSAASTKKRTYVFLGDGSFLMYGLEIHTAFQYNLPVTFFILNNNSHGMCTTRESLFLEGITGINDFKPSFYALGIEQIFPGIVAHEVNDMSELKMSLTDVAQRKGPCVISINFTNTDNPPFRTFIKQELRVQ